MIWPNKKTSEVFCDVAEGKVKRAVLKNNTVHALCSAGSFVVAVSYNYNNVLFYLHIWIIVFFVII